MWPEELHYSPVVFIKNSSSRAHPRPALRAAEMHFNKHPKESKCKV